MPGYADSEICRLARTADDDDDAAAIDANMTAQAASSSRGDGGGDDLILASLLLLPMGYVGAKCMEVKLRREAFYTVKTGVFGC